MIVEALCFISIVVAVCSVLFMKSKSSPNVEPVSLDQQKKKTKPKESKPKAKTAAAKSLPVQPVKKSKENAPKKENKSSKTPVTPVKVETYREKLEKISTFDEEFSDSDEWQTVEKKPKVKVEKPQENPSQSPEKLKKTKKTEKTSNAKPSKIELVEPVIAPKQSYIQQSFKSNPSVNMFSMDEVANLRMELEVYQKSMADTARELDSAKKECQLWEKKYNALSSGKINSTNQEKLKDGDVKEKLKKLQNAHDNLQSKFMAKESECSILREQLSEFNHKLKNIQSSDHAKKSAIADAADPILIDTLQQEINRLAKENVILTQRYELIESKIKTSNMQMTNGTEIGQMMSQPNKFNSNPPKSQLNEKQKELDELKISNEKKDKELTSLKEKLESLVKKNVELQKSINNLNQAKQSHESNIEKKKQDTQEELAKQKKTNLMIQSLESELSQLKKELQVKNENLTQVEKKHAEEVNNLKKELKEKTTEQKNAGQNGIDNKIKDVHDKQIKEFVLRLKAMENEGKEKDANIKELQEKLSLVEEKFSTPVSSKSNGTSAKTNGVSIDPKKLIEKIDYLEAELSKKMNMIKSSSVANDESLRIKLNESEKDREILANRVRELEEEMRNKFENCSINGDLISLSSQAISEEDFSSLQNQLLEERNSKQLLQKNLTKLRSLINIGQDALRDEQAKASSLREEIILLKAQLGQN